MDRERRLKVIYSQLPTVKCKWLCHDACGPVRMTMSATEARRIDRALGEPLDHDPVTLTCTALGPDKRCRVYEQRPLVCRVYGVARRLPCGFGCQPVRVMDDKEVEDTIRKIEAIDNRTKS